MTEVLLLLGALAGIAGCHSDSPRPVVVEFWAMGREGEWVQQLLPKFTERHPQIQVRVQQIPWGAAHEKLLTAYAGDVMPDVFQLGNTWVPEFVALHALEDLRAWIAHSKPVQEADYFSGILETNLIDGGLYGLPWYVDTRLLFYRKDELQAAGWNEPPRTWSEWLSAMRRIKQRGGADRYAILLPLNEWEFPVILALQRQAGLLRDHDQYGDFLSDRFRAAFADYLELFDSELAPTRGESQIANLYQEFANGYFCFYLTGPWNIGEFKRRMPASLDGQWATAPLPGQPGNYPGPSLAGGASLALFRDSPHKAEAWQFIEFLSEPAQQIIFYQLTGDLPARQSAWKEGGLIDDEYARAFWLQLQRVQPLPRIPEWERIAQKIAQYAESTIRGSLTSEEALTALNKDVDRILEKRRWLLQRTRQD
ncbi:MAG: sugar ABC transporter substrate-binding protein [Gammaproteobacteria bacterium]|nr:sugar ABC transporter substrate-binding protein [Gammaproteobacteria bacterium]MCP5459322.1 sugar ABC transporter substrate-binding protein [Gammaproteobacteria bacterium]